ncbi:MAG: MATE family efflux transporter [Solobacterium sp.]|nr:MATE family efflux transporter [Solobacterium sp.]
MNLRRYIGEKAFYRQTAAIAVPLALQSALMSCQSMIDTLMVSWIGKVSAVGTAAQIDTLAGMISYGCIGGVSIFASQFYGAGDEKNLKRCTGLGLCLALSNAMVWFLSATLFGSRILAFYMQDPQVVADGLLYLNISRFTLLVSACSFIISSMFRSTGKPGIALRISILTTICNVSLNYLLIFGAGPFPALGIRGAALATLLAQTIACLSLVGYAVYSHQPFIGSFSEMFGFTFGFIKPVLARIMPLIVNETIFGFGQTLFIKAFGYLGKAQMDVYYVGNQIFSLMTFIIYGYGNAVQILLGQRLGQGRIEQARKECDSHIGLAFVLSGILVVFLVLFARPLVMLFALPDAAVQATAVAIVKVFAVKASMRLYNFMIFCILRSGGDARIIQFLDSGIEWLVGLPCAFLCVKGLGLTSIVTVLLIAQSEQLVRLVLGMRRVKTYRWAKDLTAEV